ncbi:MAG: hypothetical protein AAGJ18_23240 [Bacteroidota bacterium]
MKKIVLGIACFLIGLTTVAAQFSVEAGLTFQTKVDKAGIQVKGLYDVTETITGAVGLNFIFSENAPGVKTSLTEFNIDGHYALINNDQFTFYPLAGLNITRSKVTFDGGTIGGFSGSASTVGLNLGGGILFPISEAISIVAEGRAIIASDNGSRIGLFAGAHYAF